MNSAHLRSLTFRSLALLIVLMPTARIASNAQNTDIFELNVFERPGSDTVGFVSLSEVLYISEHPDSTFMPEITEMPEDSASNYERIVLKDSIRKSVLSQSGLRENDRLFVYAFSKNILISIKLKELPLVAQLSPYAYEWPYHQEDYQIGFELTKKQLQGLNVMYTWALVTIGKKHPFEVGKMSNIVWQPISTSVFPTEKLSLKEESDLSSPMLEAGASYMATYDTLVFYTQELMRDSEQAGKRLLVLGKNSQQNIFEHTYYNGESTMIATPEEQYTGVLFKNRPPVVMGFTWESFGCPSIQFINPEKQTIVIRCDNRH